MPPDTSEASDFEARLEREKLDAIKELAYGASHEINNPLANIAARAQTLLRDEQQPDRRLALESIHQQAMRAHEMISDLMLFARPPALDIGPVEVATLLKNVSDHFAPVCERRNIRVQLVSLNESIELQADRQQLEIAFRAIFQNAIEAIGTDGAIEVSLVEPTAGTDQLTINITDTGVGMTDQVRRHLFSPFYSGREAGRGLGFGMSKSWRIVTDHGGTIGVSSSPGEGSAISVMLPCDRNPHEK